MVVETVLLKPGFMRKLFARTLLIVLLPVINIYGQNITGMVQYKRIYNLDTTAYKQDTTGVKSYLYFSNESSLFVYNRKKDIKEENQLSNNEVGYKMKLNEDVDEWGEMFYYDYIKKKIIIREFVWGKAFIAEENIPMLHWILDTSTRKIGRFICQKATTDFRGRKYEAWYTNEIPVSIGPWKMNGLPGLILEAYDLKREVQWIFSSIEIPYNVKKDLIIPQKGEQISFERYKTILKTESERLARFVQSSADRSRVIEIKFNYYPIEKFYE